MTSFFLPKTSSPPGAASAPPPPRAPAPLRVASSPHPPQPADVPFTKSPLLPREVTIPQPMLPVIRDVYLPRPRVEAITSLSTPTLYRYMKQGLFPRPHKLGPNRVGWSSSSVLAWMDSRIAA